MNGIYYQPQSGGLCRMHSLNAYFEHAKIMPQEFDKYQNEYDEEYKKKYNFQSSCKSFDIVGSDQKNVVSYILKKHNVYTRYYAMNQLHGKNINDNIVKILDGDFFFQYNEGHIWGNRRKDNKWYSVNSMGGVRPININSLSGQKNIGFIVPVDIQTEFYRNLQIIKDLLNNATSTSEIIKFLSQNNKEKKILGDMEIPLSICMDILETNLLSKSNAKEFNPIQYQVELYNEFLSQFTKGRYTDLKLIVRYLPTIIQQLTNLKVKKEKTDTSGLGK